MSFKEGKFYVIQGKTSDGEWVYLEGTNAATMHHQKLRQIAKRAGRPLNGRSYDDWDEDDPVTIRTSDNPFALKTYPVDTDTKVLFSMMRQIRPTCGQAGVDATTLRLAIVESTVQPYVPTSESEGETEMRKFALEKLSSEEKEILKVMHWEVYYKLGDRSMFADEDDENC